MKSNYEWIDIYDSHFDEDHPFSKACVLVPVFVKYFHELTLESEDFVRIHLLGILLDLLNRLHIDLCLFEGAIRSNLESLANEGVKGTQVFEPLK